MTRTVLAIGGHIGDMDLTAGPTLAALVARGDRAVILACTYGERGHPRLSPAEYRLQKVTEGERFAAGIGAEFRVLDHSDGFLPDDDATAEQIAEIIREVTPEILITHWPRSIHSDHVHAARLAERARFLASLPYDDGRSRHGVATLLYAENWEDADGFSPDLLVDIPEAAYETWRAAIEGEAFARGETYGFRYIDYYAALMTVRGCLAGTTRACGFATGGDHAARLTRLAGILP